MLEPSGVESRYYACIWYKENRAGLPEMFCSDTFLEIPIKCFFCELLAVIDEPWCGNSFCTCGNMKYYKSKKPATFSCKSVLVGILTQTS
jgi:hypothetical protein